MAEKAPDARPTDTDIVTTRVFDAPREAVFGAFSDPVQLAQWWGPAGFRNTITQFDLRPGGTWHYVMHGPDGTDYVSASNFVEVVRPSRVVLQHLQPGHHFFLTMTCDVVVPGKTRLTWRMTFDPAMGSELREFLSGANEQNFDRLAALLENSGSKKS